MALNMLGDTWKEIHCIPSFFEFSRFHQKQAFFPELKLDHNNPNSCVV